jgi:Esterase/lipase
MLDNVLVSYRGWLGDAAKLYANGTDLKDPMLSPIYGDFHGFPPAILTTGTRDLFLSNTVRTHRKLRDAGIEAQLIVFEGLSHRTVSCSIPPCPRARNTLGKSPHSSSDISRNSLVDTMSFAARRIPRSRFAAPRGWH